MGEYPQRAMPVEQIQWDKHDVVDCDDRGRATLGTEYANERVLVYVAEIPDEKGEYVMSKESQVLTNMLSWARQNGIKTMTDLLDPKTGVVTDKHGIEHQSPYSLGENND